jgi:hypothetical protein
MSDELKERNILKLILILRFACATLDVGYPIQFPKATRNLGMSRDVPQASHSRMQISFLQQLKVLWRVLKK